MIGSIVISMIAVAGGLLLAYMTLASWYSGALQYWALKALKVAGVLAVVVALCFGAAYLADQRHAYNLAHPYEPTVSWTGDAPVSRPLASGMLSFVGIIWYLIRRDRIKTPATGALSSINDELAKRGELK